jgi:hypothetical protein
MWRTAGIAISHAASIAAVGRSLRGSWISYVTAFSNRSRVAALEPACDSRVQACHADEPVRLETHIRWEIHLRPPVHRELGIRVPVPLVDPPQQGGVGGSLDRGADSVFRPVR